MLAGRTVCRRPEGQLIEDETVDVQRCDFNYIVNLRQLLCAVRTDLLLFTLKIVNHI